SAGADRHPTRGTAGRHRRRSGRTGAAQGVARCGVPRSPAGQAVGPVVRQPGRVRPQWTVRDVRADRTGGVGQWRTGRGARGRWANFVAPRSGGLRTAMRALGEGYVAAGHEPVLVIPGLSPMDEHTEQGRVITLPGPVLPFSGGYRMLLNRRRLTALLDRLAP